MGFGLQLLNAPLAEPVTLAEARAQVYLEDDRDDVLLRAFINAARRLAERITGKQLVEAKYKLTLDSFPDTGSVIMLPRPPLIAVVSPSVQYYNTAGTLTTLSTTLYQVDTQREPGRIAEGPQLTWEPTEAGRINAVSVTYLAGHLASFTADATTNEVTTNKVHANGMSVRLSTSEGGSLPAPLVSGTDYYVVNANAAGTTFQLSATSGGSAIDLTNTGNGTLYLGELPADINHGMRLLISHWYEFRSEGVEMVEKIINRIPAGAQELLRGSWMGWKWA